MGISLEKLLRQLGINPGDVLVDVPQGTNPFYGHIVDPGAGTDKTQSYSVASGTQLDVRESFVVGWVIVDNNTSAWINIPDATRDGTGRFVGPGLGGAFPILGHISRSRINWLAPPGKAQPAFIAGEQAQVIFGSGAAPPGFGFAAPIPFLRWNIFSAPAAGSQATAVQAAVTGVTHVADSAIWSAATTAAPGAAVESAFSILDGATTLHTGAASLQNVAGDRFAFGIGPVLQQKGTPGNSMTVQWAAGMTGTVERVSLAGYDQ